MKLGYFPYVFYGHFDSTGRDDVEGLALVALANDVRAVELVPVLIKGSRRWRVVFLSSRGGAGEPSMRANPDAIATALGRGGPSSAGTREAWGDSSMTLRMLVGKLVC